jgi:hypothetical protein
MRNRVWLSYLAGALVMAAGCARPAVPVLAVHPPCTDAPDTTLFSFRSSFWLNLHNFLVWEARGRQALRNAPGSQDAIGLDTLRENTLTPADSVAWNRAVSYYTRAVLSRPKPDSVVIVVNNRLAASGELPDSDARYATPEFSLVLQEVAPTYRAVWWPQHDRWNRVWIGHAADWVRREGSCLRRELGTVFQAAWPNEPMQVDATVAASWFGAYTTLDPAHITLSTSAIGNQAGYALESLLHEAGHSLLAPLERKIAAAFTHRRRLEPVPGQLAHSILFYTAGELVRARVADHVPYATRFGLWNRSDNMREMRRRLDRHWQPYLRGQTTMDAVVNALVASY